jgi:hypothetical protein
MSTTIETENPHFVKLELRTAYGRVSRDISTKPPREARDSENPLIELSRIYGELEARKSLAKEIKSAAENTGFFYIENHGISEDIVNAARQASETFFKQPLEKGQLVSKNLGKWYNGYSGKNTAMASPTKGRQCSRHPKRRLPF